MLEDAAGRPYQSSFERGLDLDPDFWRRVSSGFGSSQIPSTQKVLSRPFTGNAWVYACCQAISQNLIQLPHVLKYRGAKDLIPDHPILSLFQNPNPLMSGTDLWEAIILNLLLSTSRTPGGQCFLIAESGKKGKRVNLKAGEIPAEIYPFSDETIYPIKDQSGMLIGWELQVGTQRIPYGLEEVIRIRLYNPYDLFLGMSPIYAALAAVAKDAEASNLNLQFFKQGATLGGVLTTDEELRDEKMKSLRTMWNDTYSGSQNGGKTAVLHSGLKYEQFARSHIDMQFLDQLKWSRDEYCAVYRVPKSELSIYEDVRDDSAKASDHAFWTKVVMPYDKRIWSAINSGWLNNVERGRTLEGVSDYTDVEALQAFIGDKIDNAQKLVGMNVPVEEAARVVHLNIDVQKYPWLKTAYVNMGLIDIQQLDTLNDINIDNAENPPEPPTPATPPNSSSDQGDPKSDVSKSFDSFARSIVVTKDLRDKKINAYVNGVLDPSERIFKKTFERYFISQRNKILDSVDEWEKRLTKATPGQVRAAINTADFLPNEVTEGLILSGLATPIYVQQVERVSSELKTELGGKFFVWNGKNPYIEASIRTRAQKLPEINTTTFRAVGGKIAKVVQDITPTNPSISEMAKAIKAAVSDVYTIRNSQATTIARTENGVISSDTRYDVMRAEGIRRHSWGAYIDTTTRDDHEEEDGHIVTIGNSFPITHLKHPHDTTGAAEQYINCRCVALMERDDGE